MIRSKLALISSAIILCICLYLNFSISNDIKLDARSTFMSFPISNQNGYIVVGIIGSVLFMIALVLLVIGIKKFYFRTVIIVAIVHGLLPLILMTLYQETLASGIEAISYDGNGKCNFDLMNEDLLKGECDFVLHNHSNEAVSFELELLDSYFMDDGVRMESLMNLAGPYRFTIKANDKKSFHLNDILEVSGVPKHIEGGTSFKVHFKLIDGENTRTI